jgi:Natural resistance-associated macrophage protein
LTLFVSLQVVLQAERIMNMPIAPPPKAIEQPQRPSWRDVMGPGLITGASDDDPSGIATYSQAGAQFGYSLGWTLLLTYPLMCAIQLISAQMGRVTPEISVGTTRRRCFIRLSVCSSSPTRSTSEPIWEPWPQRFACSSMDPRLCTSPASRS